MTTIEFPPELEGQIHQMVIQLGNLLAMVPTQTPPQAADPNFAKGLSPEDMVEFTSMLLMDMARRTLLSACASYEATASVHRMLTPGVRPHA